MRPPQPPPPGSFEAFKRRYPRDSKRAYNEYRKSLGTSYLDQDGVRHPATAKFRRGADSGLLLMVIFGPIVLVLGIVAICTVIFLAFAIPTLAVVYALNSMDVSYEQQQVLFPIALCGLYVLGLYVMYERYRKTGKIFF